MSKLKHVLVVILVTSLLLVSSGCELPWPFNWSKGETDTTLDPPNYSSGHGTSQVDYIPVDFQRAVEQVRTAIVRLESTQVEEGWFLRPFPRETVGIGTGIVIDTDNGYIITNWHVVEDASKITVSLYEGSEISATHYVSAPSHDIETDLALVKVNPDDLPSDVVAAQLYDGTLEPYTWAVAIGYPYDIGSSTANPTVSQGIISALDRRIRITIGNDTLTLEDVIQTDAAINPGNSGGPLLNLDGFIIGVNTAVLEEAENMGFAISKDTVQEFLDEVREDFGG